MVKEDSNDKPAFLGAVTASVAHELQNVLAIIKETSGLMQDNLYMYQDSLTPDLAEKLSKIILKIQKQIERGVGITSELNGFAHTADLSIASVDILAVIKKLVFLTSRIFNNKGLSIQIGSCIEPLSVKTDPLCFQMLIFKVLQYYGGSDVKTAVLNISTANNDGLNITITRTSDCVSDVSMQAGILKRIVDLSNQINAPIKFSKDNADIFIRL